MHTYTLTGHPAIEKRPRRSAALPVVMPVIGGATAAATKRGPPRRDASDWWRNCGRDEARHFPPLRQDEVAEFGIDVRGQELLAREREGVSPHGKELVPVGGH